MQVIYWLALFVAYTSLYLSKIYKDKHIFLFIAQGIATFRSIIRTFDIENTQHINLDGRRPEFNLE